MVYQAKIKMIRKEYKQQLLKNNLILMAPSILMIYYFQVKEQ